MLKSRPAAARSIAGATRTAIRLFPFAAPFAAVVWLAAAPLFAQGLPRAAPESVGMSSERLGRLTAALQEYVDEGRVAGAVALVARRGKVVFHEAVGFRDQESGSPMETDSIFRIASQTKSLVSVGIMQLQEEGRLLITDPVGDYLPEFAETTVAEPDAGGGYRVVPAERPIRIRDLLTHTAGISYGGGPAGDAWAEAGITGWYFADREEPVGAIMNRLAQLPLDDHPGEAWIYGYNTDILGALIEEMSGGTLEAFLDDRVFAPLGLEDTHFFLPPEKIERLTTVYSSAAGEGIERAPDPGGMVGQGAYVRGPRRSFSGGAGLLSTAEDYAVFLQALLDGGAWNDARILSRKSVESMTADHLGDVPFRRGYGFGLGFEVLMEPAAIGLPASPGEFSWGGAYHSTYWVDPMEEMVVVYMTQLIPARDIDDHGKLRALVHQAIVD